MPLMRKATSRWRTRRPADERQRKQTCAAVVLGWKAPSASSVLSALRTCFSSLGASIGALVREHTSFTTSKISSSPCHGESGSSCADLPSTSWRAGSSSRPPDPPSHTRRARFKDVRNGRKLPQPFQFSRTSGNSAFRRDASGPPLTGDADSSTVCQIRFAISDNSLAVAGLTDREAVGAWDVVGAGSDEPTSAGEGRSFKTRSEALCSCPAICPGVASTLAWGG